MADNTSLIIVVIIFTVVFFLIDSNKRRSRYSVVPRSRCGTEGYKNKSYMLDSSASVRDDTAMDNNERENEYDDEYEDYSNYVLSNGLEQSVLSSHNQYVEDIDARKSGSSADTVTSHDENINPWVGLRRPSYDVVVSPHAREVPSQTPEQLFESSNKKKFGYF